MEKPEPTPEGALIRLAREAARIKTPSAARRAGISTARWSQIENGYETRPGAFKPVTAPPATLAHMAHAVGLKPGRLEEAGRPDAAQILREILHQESGDKDEADALRETKGAAADDVQYDDPAIQRVWEASRGLEEDVRRAMVALALGMREQREQERRRETSA